jgi:4-hydroxybenzoyl-CoA reductase subunit beta
MSNEVMPDFQLIRPATVTEAVAALAKPEAQICAGGTDVLVQLRMGLTTAATLIDITGIEALKTIGHSDKGSRIGAGVTLVELARDTHISTEYLSVTKAAASIAGPTHREVATIGGNLCLDTRCLYYNQSHWWRQANAFCLKYKGDICHVAPKGNRCRAAFSGELAPALMVHNASLEIIGPEGMRTLPLADFYAEDGTEYINLKTGEIIVAVHVPPALGSSDYKKVSVRSSLDFPLAGVAVASEKVDGNTRNASRQ